MLVIATILFILLSSSIIADGISAYYKSKYIRVMEQQNELLKDALRQSSSILVETVKTMAKANKEDGVR